MTKIKFNQPGFHPMKFVLFLATLATAILAIYTPHLANLLNINFETYKTLTSITFLLGFAFISYWNYQVIQNNLKLSNADKERYRQDIIKLSNHIQAAQKLLAKNHIYPHPNTPNYLSNSEYEEAKAYWDVEINTRQTYDLNNLN